MHAHQSKSHSPLSVADSLTGDSNDELNGAVCSQSGVASSSARCADLQASISRRSMSVRGHELSGQKLAGRIADSGSGLGYHRQDHKQAGLDVGEFGEMPE